MARRMDTYLKTLVSEDRYTFYEAVRDFAKEQVEPKLLSLERKHVLISDELISSMAKMGLFGITVKEEYGGQGGGLTELVLMGLALGYHSQSMAITPGLPSGLVMAWTTTWLAHLALVDQHFSPLMIQFPFFLFAVTSGLAASEPRPGSESPKTNIRLPAARSGRCAFFCSSFP